MSEIVNGWSDDSVKKLWNKDSSLWTSHGEEKWLGWLDVVPKQIARLDELLKIQSHFKKFKQIALLGMGGSSLGPEVIAKTFGNAEGYPSLSVLDSTDPDQILSFDKSLDIKSTCFIVSSKSGSTLEPNVFLEYFYSRAKEVLGVDCGNHFVAITDPGSNMEKRARDLGFSHIFYGDQTIGGRFSALSDFGIIPALALGVDMTKYLKQTFQMVKVCQDVEQNPGVELGLCLGGLARKGQDKLSLIASPELSHLPGWIEQLVAESTGKNGLGIIPVVETKIDDPAVFGKDRNFIFLKYGKSVHNFDKEIEGLKKAGHPVMELLTQDLYDLGQEFFRWEIATAVAGAILRVNPFDQPDVEASKIETKRLTSEFEKTGSLPLDNPIFSDETFDVYTDLTNWAHFKNVKSVREIVRTHFGRIKPNDYVGLLAYVDMNKATEKSLAASKDLIQSQSQAAVCVGFGPRFLHSTGQAYKGGPNTGVFLQIMGQPKHDLNIPNHKFTFSVVLKAQALGDFQVLLSRKRRVLQILIKGDLEVGLEKLNSFFQA